MAEQFSDDVAQVRADVVIAMGRAIAGCAPHLAGIGAHLQGAVLGELVSIWIAGHHPDIREEVLLQWIDYVRTLIPINEQIRYRDRPRPEGWPPLAAEH